MLFRSLIENHLALSKLDFMYVAMISGVFILAHELLMMALGDAVHEQSVYGSASDSCISELWSGLW